MIIDNKIIDEVAARAEASPLLHADVAVAADAGDAQSVHFFLPGAIVPVRRRHTPVTYVLLRGKMSVVTYDETGGQTDRILLDALAGHYGVHLPAGCFHNVEVGMPSALLEVADSPCGEPEPEDTLD